jgi:hypothetical protein
MPTPPDPNGVHPEAEGNAWRIDEAVQTIQAPVKKLSQDVITNRQHLRLITWILAVDLILSLAVGALGYFVNQAARQARASVVAACQAGNEFKKLDKQRWDYIITLSANNPQPNQTPAQRQQAAANLKSFEQFLAIADAPRDCPK